VIVALLLLGVPGFWPQRPRVLDRPVFNSADVVYYSPAEYLPPIDTGVQHDQLPQRGEPEFAPQPIISVPPEADNNTQTIVTPPNLKLNRDIPLPNIVAWPGAQPAVPLAATSTDARNVKLPELPTSVVAPPPEVSVTARAQNLQAPQPAIVEPPPSVESASTRKWGDLNIGHTKVVAPAPQLPVAEQRSLGNMAQAPLSNAGPAVVPPPPSLAGAASNRGGQIIALGIHPAVLKAPVEVPSGNRRGTFAAGPQGKPGAPGTPDIPRSANHGNGNGGGFGDTAKGVPPGLYVGGAAPAHSGVAGNGTGGDKHSAGDPRLMAEVTPPRVTASPKRLALEASVDNPTEMERKVFGDRKFYSMTLNMPNLNSGGGSWVIRFAELHENQDKSELVAPLATQEVDPAYPLELMRRGIQGTVTLYAIIRSDGSVGEVRVLRGVNDRLDEYARTALSGWRFTPATKGGTAIDLEAVVMIPFRMLHKRPDF
jgi:TonB family protein